MPNRRDLMTGIAGTALAAPMILNPTKALAATVQSVKTHEFMEFLRLNAHLNFGDVWAGVDWRQKFLDLHIRYVRTGVGSTTATLAQTDDHAVALYQSGGVKLITTILNQIQPTDCTPTTAEVQAAMDDIKSLGGSLPAFAVIGELEGPNEYNHLAQWCYGTGWQNDLRDIQQKIWTYSRDIAYGWVDANGVAKGPVLGPSLWGNRSYDSGLFAQTDSEFYMNQAVLHCYPDNRKPSQYGRRTLVNGSEVVTDADLTQALQDIQLIKPSKGVATTEAGYRVGRITTNAQSKYIGRLIMEYFLRRLTLSNLSESLALYALLDNPDGAQLGLLDLSLNPRPSYYTVRNMLAKLDDGAWNGSSWAYHKNFTPAALDVVTSGLPSTGHYVVMQKSNGKFYVVIWNDLLSCTRTTGTPADIDNTPYPSVQFTFGQQFSNLAHYDVTVLDGENPDNKRDTPNVALNNTNAITVTMKDHVGILILTP